MPDLSDLTNEELEAAIANPNPDTNPEEPAKPATEVPETPETPAEEPEPTEEPDAEVEEPVEVPEEEPATLPSRREQLRINQLLEKLKQQPSAPSVQTPSTNLADTIDADPEVIKQLEADRQAAISSAVAENQVQMQTYRWETMVNLDNPHVEAKYPQLDKNSEDYHPALADSLGKMYFQLSGLVPGQNGTYTVTNPGMRWKDFVDSYYETADEIANEKLRASTKNVAKQAAQTGLRPDGSKTKRLNLNQAPDQMSDEELKAVIEQAGI